MIEHFLSAHQMLGATDGEQGLKLLQKHPEINLILLDLKMPKIDGFEFLICVSR